MAIRSTHAARHAGPLHFPCDTAVLASVREQVKAFALSHGASETQADDLVLAADEVCSNVVSHAYPGMSPAGFWVEFEACAGLLVVTVRDRGVAFDQSAQPSHDVRDWLRRGGKGGLGLPLIRTLVEDLEYSRTSDGCNDIRLIKRIC